MKLLKFLKTSLYEVLPQKSMLAHKHKMVPCLRMRFPEVSISQAQGRLGI